MLVWISSSEKSSCCTFCCWHFQGSPYFFWNSLLVCSHPWSAHLVYHLYTHEIYHPLCTFVVRYLGHCLSYAVVASVLLGAAVLHYISVTDPLAARRDALQSTVIRLREGFRKKEHNSSPSYSEGCGSSMKHSSNIGVGHLINAVETSSQPSNAAESIRAEGLIHESEEVNNWHSAEVLGTVSYNEAVRIEKSLDSSRPSITMSSNSCLSIFQEPEISSALVERNMDHNGPLIACSSGGLESQDFESTVSTSIPLNLDLNFSLDLQERLKDPRVTSMIKRKVAQGQHELAGLLQDKGLDANFAMMLEDKSLDPTILALLQRSSLDADRDRQDNNEEINIDSTHIDSVLPNLISLSEELRVKGLERWLHLSRTILHHLAGAPERAWVLFSSIFVVETIIVAIIRPTTVQLMSTAHQQVNFKLPC